MAETSARQIPAVEAYLDPACREVLVSPEQLQGAERAILRVLSESHEPMALAQLLEQALRLLEDERTMPIRIAVWNLVELGAVVRTSVDELVLASWAACEARPASAG